MKQLAASIFIVASAASAHAEKPRFHDVEGFGTWLDGNPETTAITEDGLVTLGAAARERYVDAAASFSAAAAWGDDIILARVADAQVFAVDRAGKTRDLFKPDATTVTALLVDDDHLFVATGPAAKVYRVDRKGGAAVFYTPDAEFVWEMVAGEDGSIYAVTGNPGTLQRIDDKGSAKVLFAPEQKHLRSVHRDTKLGLFVGGGERGVVYRAAPGREDKFVALYDSGHPEITAITSHAGYVYVAAVSGAQALASDDAFEGGKKGPEVRSQFVRLGMDGIAEVLAGSTDEGVFDAAVDDKGRLVVATGSTGKVDPRGRLYTVDPERREIAMIYQSPSRRITHLVKLPRDAIAAVAASGGRVVHVAGGIAPSGEFLTAPFDTTLTARFGLVQVAGHVPAGTKASVAVRTGQTEAPDDSWSDWSVEIAFPGGVTAQVPRGRFVQMRLTLASDGKVAPKVSRLRLAYLRQNQRPYVSEIVALRKGLALLPIVAEAPKSRNVNLSDKASKDSQKPNGKDDKPDKQQARQVERAGALTLKWVAQDPNEDDLRYDLRVRTAHDGDWRLVKGDLEDPFYTLDAGQLPDGHYQFRVQVRDDAVNPQGLALSDHRDSEAVLIDNTPPRIEPLRVEVSGKKVTVQVKVADTVGPLIDAGYAVDGGAYLIAMADDGVLDGPGETLTIRLSDLAAGSHTLTLRVKDEGENVGMGEARFEVR